MSSVQCWIFCGIALIQVGSPGPSTVFLINNAISFGSMRAIGILSGDLLAIAVLAILSLLGVDAILIANPHLFMALKFAGALYLIWLGLDQWRHHAANKVAAPVSRPGQSSAMFLWSKSFLIGISNPKAILFFSSLLPQFIDPAHTGTPQLLSLIVLFMLIKLLVLGTYAVMAQKMSGLVKNPNHARNGKIATGLILITFGSVIAISALR